MDWSHLPVTSTSLTHRRQKFVEAFVETGLARASARQAGYSERSAHTTAWRLLNDVEVQQAIETERETLRARVELVPGSVSGRVT